MYYSLTFYINMTESKSESIRAAHGNALWEIFLQSMDCLFTLYFRNGSRFKGLSDIRLQVLGNRKSWGNILSQDGLQ